MFWRKRHFVGNLLIGGSIGSFILSILLATIVYDDPPAGTDAYVPEIEMAMIADPLTQESEVWMDYVFPMHIIARISKIQKVDKDGVARSGSMVDIFPTNGPTTSRGTVNFKIQFVERSAIPSFANQTLKMMPMFYIRQSSFPEFEKSLFKFTVLCVGNLGFVCFVLIVWSFALILGGAYMIYKVRTKNRKPVRKRIESPVVLKKEIPPNSLLVPN